MMSVPNFYRLETARHRLDAYDVFIEALLDVREGNLHVPDSPGLGVEMNMDFLRSNADEQYRGE
jgi:galactonate dehydratase